MVAMARLDIKKLVDNGVHLSTVVRNLCHSDNSDVGAGEIKCKNAYHVELRKI